MSIPIAEWQKEVHKLAKEKGWYDEDKIRPFPEFVANLHGEVSELFEAYRKVELYDPCDKDCKLNFFQEEVADIFIRLCDMCEYHNIDLEGAAKVKHEYNKTRKHRHGGKRA